MDEKIEKYILISSSQPAIQKKYKLAEPKRYLFFGVPPRGSINLAMAQLFAGASNVEALRIPEDVRAVVQHVLRHYESVSRTKPKLKRGTFRILINKIVNEIEVP
jgi:MoxR-like ATPase